MSNPTWRVFTAPYLARAAASVETLRAMVALYAPGVVVPSSALTREREVLELAISHFVVDQHHAHGEVRTRKARDAVGGDSKPPVEKSDSLPDFAERLDRAATMLRDGPYDRSVLRRLQTGLSAEEGRPTGRHRSSETALSSARHDLHDLLPLVAPAGTADPFAWLLALMESLAASRRPPSSALRQDAAQRLSLLSDYLWSAVRQRDTGRGPEGHTLQQSRRNFIFALLDILQRLTGRSPVTSAVMSVAGKATSTPPIEALNYLFSSLAEVLRQRGQALSGAEAANTHEPLLRASGLRFSKALLRREIQIYRKASGALPRD